METVYYNSTTGEKTCLPFKDPSKFTLPEGYQWDEPVIPQTFEDFKEQAKDDMNKAFLAGIKTSIRDIVMQCRDWDVTVISLSNVKNFVRDIDNNMHEVTESEYNQIVEDVKTGYGIILQDYWNKIDNFV